MIPKFKFRLLSKSKILNNTSASIVFIFSFLLIFFTKTDYYLIDRIKSVSNEIINPVTKIVSLPVTASFNAINQFNNFVILQDENIKLKEEILRLKKWQILAIQNSRENRVLKKLLNATDNNLTLVKTASLINRNDILFSKTININAGYKSGIKNDMSVINHRGLVGRIISASKNNSKVLLIVDQNLSVPVKSISTGQSSIVMGSEDGTHLVSSFIKDDNLPKKGDLLVTSGNASIFPPDILVGKIVKIKKNRFYVLPFVDFNNIEYVQVVKSE
tara:strand:+ start:7628 stop:8449 length:822 start_codon:yes stop_codon:yes gene_type:complete